MSTKKIEPYELSGPKYKVWYEIGVLKGIRVKSFVAEALCNGSHVIHRDNLISGDEEAIKQVANKHGVIIYFK